jgi:YebC/PmpR family DNA-binding regulatory protein
VRRLAGPAPSVALAASVSEPFSIVASGRPRLGPLWGRRAAKIANTKNRSDLRRSKVYARFGKKIIMAVKAGGSADESANLMLRDVIREARAANVPTTNIERAIKRASDSDTADFKESTFEAYGKGGAGIVITVLTDNNNRATSDVKSTITHSGLTFASPGSVMFNFKRLGALVCAQPVSEDTAIEAAMEAGVDDVEVKEGDGGWLVLTDPKDLVPLKAALAAKGVECGEVKLVYHPTAAVECSDADAEFNEAAIERLEDLDDVDAVAHNMA